MENTRTALVHLASGIGNIVLATPLLVALGELGLTIDVALDADYRQTATLLQPWSLIRRICKFPVDAGADCDLIIPAIPPFYWPRFAAAYRKKKNVVARPPDSLFYNNEQSYYLAFARSLGYPDQQKPLCRLPIAPVLRFGVGSQTLVIAPGSKTGEMASKRWPWFAHLAERFEDVAIVGTEEDAAAFGGKPWNFPPHARSLLGVLNLRETAELLASAGAVVANDSGLAHVAAAVGTPTLILFGPTPDQTLGQFPPNVRILRRPFKCAPCWHGQRLAACHSRVDCLLSLEAGEVESAARQLLGHAIRKDVEPANAPAILASRPPEMLRPDALTEHCQAVSQGPLVTCIMPTAGRRRLVAQSARYFLRQDYANRELLILDDGAHADAAGVPSDPRIRYVRLEGPRTLGAKRNLACEMASGEFIAHWDDDDWSSPHRLSLQMRALTENPSIGLCGLASIYFFDPLRQRAWIYQHPSGQRSWVAGGTMCYRKDFWSHIRFPDVSEGEDTRFAWADRASRILPLNDPSIYVATVHPRNTSPKHISDSRWHSCSVDSIRELLGEDWPFYMNWASLGVEEATNGSPGNGSFSGSGVHELSQKNLTDPIPSNASRGVATC